MKNIVPSNPVAASSAAVPAPTQATPQQPTYGQTYFDSGARFPITVPGLPVDDGGIVRIGTGRLTDTELLNVLLAENTAITGNPAFPTPNPTVVEMSAAITDLQDKLANMTYLKSLLKSATTDKDVSRSTAEALFKSRAAYVQLASNGNKGLIESAGFSVRATPTPVGILPPPSNLFIELNGTPGLLLLSWSSVEFSRAYVIQCSPANTMAREWSPLKTSSVARLRIDGLTLGQVYAFRIAAVGGSTGQSDWSAEVIRMAA
jgi:hypothetical protein